MVKVNLGSGVYLLKGFLNVDLYEKDQVGKGKYLKADIRELPLKDASVDYVLAAQVLEHLPIKDIEKTLKEWLRILKKGGRMVITVPDFNQQCQEWLENTPWDYETHFYLAEGMYGDQSSEGEYHRAPITPQLLQYHLQRMGVEGKMNVIQKGEPMRQYPGYGEKDRVYRFGEVHIDCIKV